MTVNERAADLRRVLEQYDAGAPATNSAGRLMPGAKAELAAIDPVIVAAEALLDEIGTPEVTE